MSGIVLAILVPHFLVSHPVRGALLRLPSLTYTTTLIEADIPSQSTAGLNIVHDTKQDTNE